MTEGRQALSMEDETTYQVDPVSSHPQVFAEWWPYAVPRVDSTGTIRTGRNWWFYAFTQDEEHTTMRFARRADAEGYARDRERHEATGTGTQGGGK